MGARRSCGQWYEKVQTGHVTRRNSQEEGEGNRWYEKVQTGHVTGRNNQDEREGNRWNDEVQTGHVTRRKSQDEREGNRWNEEFRQAMSPEEKAKISKKETKKRKRLTIEKNMLNVSRRQRNFYTELKILSILTNTNPLFALFVINLLSVQR